MDPTQITSWHVILDASMKRGIAVDLEYAVTKQKELSAEAAQIRSTILDMAGEEFDLRSSQQLGIILFEKLALRPAHRVSGICGTYDTYEVDNARLEAIDHPIAQLVLAHRSASAGAGALKHAVEWERKGRVHPAAIADRIGAIHLTNPMIQSTPKGVRKVVTADPGHVLLSADWRTMHLRLLANLSLDPQLIELLSTNPDPFNELAAMLYGENTGCVTAIQADKTKTITYARLYGRDCEALAVQHRLPKDAVRAYTDIFAKRFSKAHRWIQRECRRAREAGHATTIAGRAVELSYLGTRVRRNGGIVNAILQGSEADILMGVIPRVASALVAVEGHLMFPIHDEIMIQVPGGAEREAHDILMASMTDLDRDLALPLSVRVKVGRNWGDLHEF